MVRGTTLALVAAAALLVAVAPVNAQQGTIRVSGGQFVDDNCNPFYFSGYNTWQILETAGGVCCGGKASVQKQLDTAQANNLTVVRMFAYGVSYGYQLQTNEARGYNESALKDMDFVISEASKRNLKLIVSLASNWIYGPNTTGTKCYYTNNSNTALTCDDFFTDATAIQLYKDNAKTLAARVNTITNVAYGSDPTIFAWDLINEPRCDSTTDGCSAAGIQSWIASVAPYVKSVVKQLVTVGEDGFMQASNCLADKTNPVTNSIGWPLQTGQDFMPNHAVDGIDFAAIHFWPDNWGRTDLDFGKNWMTAHANMSTLLQKPLIVEEFGKAYGGNTLESGQGQTAQQQVDYYKLVYSIVEASIDQGGVIKGIAFWRWAAAQSPDTTLAAFDNAATIATDSSTFTTVIGPVSQRVARLVSAPSGAVQGCTKGSSSTAPAAATSAAGRRLMQSASAPSSSAANANSLIPASLCGAFPPQPASVGR
jgi:mannan endo-1,4-beta-mannosidase